MPADRQAMTARARETARRRGAYTAIDAAYRAHLITETARELAKWYVRQCCGVRCYHDLTQAAQAQQFGVNRRTIITLVQQLVAADLIWLEQHGTRNRTYLTSYQAPPEDAPAADAPSAPASDEEAPAYQQLRAAADAALDAGDTARAAMYEYQAAMELARLSNSDAAPVFGARHGDPQITLNVQSGSPSPVNKDSDLPIGEIESSVCIADGDDSKSSAQATDPGMPTIPDTEATRLMRACGVLSPAMLRKHAVAPLELIRRAEQRRAELGYSAGLIGRILDDGGVIWGRCRQPVDHASRGCESDDKYTTGALARYYRQLRPNHPPSDVGGLPPHTDEPPGDTSPDDDPELVKYRDIGMPCWGDGGGP
jgi:hypothetical protein